MPEGKSEWNDYRSPPHRDGRKFLAVVDGAVRMVAYVKISHVPIYGWCLMDQGAEDCDLCSFEHWMPLPLPPSTEESLQHD